MVTRFGSIEPSKNAYERVGKGSTHDLNEAIAELVDNSIEARADGQKDGTEQLEINITLDRVQIEVSDNAKGMAEKEAISSLRLFETSKKGNELGGFGIGMKAASLSVGNTLELITGQQDSHEEYAVRFNIDEWNNNKNLTWNHYPYRTNDSKPLSKHGTTIIISDLRTNITPLKVEKLRKSLGSRYRSFIEHNNLLIKVQDVPCRPQKIEWREGYPKPFEIECRYGRIYGVMGLMKESKQIGTWGFDLFRNNRLIMQEQKFAVSGHPSHAFISGEIHLDFVPINQDKNKFRTDSPQFEEALKVCMESDAFKEIASASSRAGHPSGNYHKVDDRVADVIDALATIYSRKDRKEEIPAEALAASRTQLGTKESVSVERRDGGSSNPSQEHQGGGSPKEREPKHTHKVFRWKMRNGKQFRIIHGWINMENLGRKSYEVDESSGVLTIRTNEAFPAFKMARDLIFYASEDIVDAIAELEGRDNNFTIAKLYEYRDSLLKDVCEVLMKKKSIRARNYVGA